MSGNWTRGICVTGRYVTNYTNTDKPPTRFELVTFRLLSECSANWAIEASLLIFLLCCKRNSRWTGKGRKNKKKAPTVGLEPTTTRLRVLRSTNWARRDECSDGDTPACCIAAYGRDTGNDSLLCKSVSGYWRNRKRATLARSRYWDRNPDTPQRSYGLVGYDARLTRGRSPVQSWVRILLASVVQW